MCPKIDNRERVVESVSVATLGLLKPALIVATANSLQRFIGIASHKTRITPKQALAANLAAARGDKIAAKNLEIVEKRMTSAQVARAQAMAAKWKPKKAKQTK